jgi:tetratricopeptide (TPR) repeat protein
MERYTDTLAKLNQALSQNPNDMRAIANRGETYRLMGRYNEAVADFSRVIDLEPNHAWAIAHRGAAYRGMKRQEAALADLNAAIDLKPDYAWALIHRANIYTMMRRYEDALVDVDKALAVNHTIIPHWPGERGLLLSYLGRYAQAIACCEQGLKANPDDFVTLYTLAVIKAHQNGLTEAQAYIDKTRAAAQAMVNTEERALALYRLGGLMALEGHREQALDYLQEAISLENEPWALAHHDLAWLEMRNDPRFQSLVFSSTTYV